QAQGKAGALALGRVNFHLALVVVGNDEVRHGQTKPRALANFLGGEEGFENSFAYSLGHADAVVLDLYFSPGRVESGAQGYAPRLALVGTLMNGLGGVLQQVEQYLLQFVGDTGNRPQLRVELADNGLPHKVK